MKGRPCVFLTTTALLTVTEAFVATPRVALVSNARPMAIMRLSAASLNDLEATPSIDFEQPVENPASAYIEGEGMATRRNEFDVGALINLGFMLLGVMGILVKLALVNPAVLSGDFFSASAMMEHLPKDIWTNYMQVLSESPVETKAVTSASVYTLGDVIAQHTEGREMGELDRMRVIRSLLAGLIGHGPLSHYWYNLCDGLFDNVLHWTEWWSFFPKVVVDQAAWGPFWNNTYILLLGLMKLESFGNIWGDVKRTTVPLVISGLKLWPLAHCVTYGLVPVENRLLWVDIVEILWVTILATQAADAAASHHATDAAEPLGD